MNNIKKVASCLALLLIIILASGFRVMATEKETKAAVQVPYDIDFILDPFEINEKGQVYSKEYFFYNSGSVPITLQLTDIKCKLDDAVQIAKDNEDEQTIRKSENKKARLVIHFNDETQEVTDAGGDYEVLLEPAERLTFYLTGCISETPAEEWDKGDITIQMNYGWAVEEELEELGKDEEISIPSASPLLTQMPEETSASPMEETETASTPSQTPTADPTSETSATPMPTLSKETSDETINALPSIMPDGPEEATPEAEKEELIQPTPISESIIETDTSKQDEPSEIQEPIMEDPQ